MKSGKTTRSILSALTYLSEGYDVVIVAHPAAEAFEIADRVHALAQYLGIPCEMSEDNRIARESESPVIVTRPYTWEPEWSTILPDWRVRPKIVIDHSAQFERGGRGEMAAMNGRVRSVPTAADMERMRERVKESFARKIGMVTGGQEVKSGVVYLTADGVIHE